MCLRKLVLLYLILGIACGHPGREGPDLLFYNGAIYTMDPLQPLVSAIAIHNGRILAIGGDNEIRTLAGTNTKQVDLGRQFMMPGFIEGHGHFYELGYTRINLYLRDTTSWAGVVNAVKARNESTPAGRWITGRGWHQEKFTDLGSDQVAGYPTHLALSAASPDHPVFLKHASGHALIANQAAMTAAGIDASTPDPAGGRIIRQPDGKPTGVFEENAMGLITDPWQQWLQDRPEHIQLEEWTEALIHAEAICLEFGITSFQDAGTRRPRLNFLREVVESGRLQIRIWAMLLTNLQDWDEHSAGLPWKHLSNDRLTVRSIKAYVDGALGSYGAWLLEPYHDSPELTGQTVTPVDSLKELCHLALRRNLQVCIHAIGDRGNREVLNMYEELFLANPDKDNLRWRIEHAQHVDTSDIPRFAGLGVVASMQPIHCISDAPFVEKRLGPGRAQTGAYVWRSLLDYGTRFAIGTDAPIEPVDPFLNIYAAITRKQLDNKQSFYPEQAMTRKEALHSYTLGNAWAAFEEKEKGSLSPGKWADMIILSQNILTCPEEAILQIKVRRTFIAGEEVYRMSGLQPL